MERTNLRFNIGHNGYLEVFVEAGFVGIVLLAGLIISSFFKIQKTLQSNYDYGVLRLCLLLMIVICNLTESSFARPQDFLWFVFLLLAMSRPDKDYVPTDGKSRGLPPLTGSNPYATVGLRGPGQPLRLVQFWTNYGA